MSAALRQLFTRSCSLICKQGDILKLNNNVKLVPITNTINYKKFSISNLQHQQITPHEVVDPKRDEIITKDTIDKVNKQIASRTHGRLFAVVHLCGKQFKITTGDAIVIEGGWPPDVGDKISLNKVLLVGSSDFTLIGRPLIQPGLCNIVATVVEKSLSHTKTNFKKKRRKQYQRINFYRFQQTMLRITNIELSGEVNDPPDVSSSTTVKY